jgi:hypothetical protein
MKDQVQISVRYILPARVIGIVVAVVHLSMLAAGVLPCFSIATRRPGMLLAELMRFGAYDLPA